jgi:tetratricopeptide (TPR) repeat protein
MRLWTVTFAIGEFYHKRQTKRILRKFDKTNVPGSKLLLMADDIPQSSGYDIETLDGLLKGLSKEQAPQKWARLMNLKGMVLIGLGRYEDAVGTFMEALKLDDGVHRSKVFINLAKLNYISNNAAKTLELLGKVFEQSKLDKKFPQNLLGHSHLLRGQVYNLKKEESKTMAEFRKAEYFFEVAANARGVGLSCMEMARNYIKKQELQTAWNFLRKSELFFSKLGDEEKLGVVICKAVALYYSGKGPEAMELLRGVYAGHANLGKGIYTIDEIIDAYLDVKNRMLTYQDDLI